MDPVVSVQNKNFTGNTKELAEVLGIPLPFLGCQPDALISAYWGFASRTRVESAYCHVLRSFFDHRRERDRSWCQDKPYFLAFDYDTVLKSIAGRTMLMMGSDDDVLHTVPCFEDYALLHTILCLDWAGRDFSFNLVRFSRSGGIFMTAKSGKSFVVSKRSFTTLLWTSTQSSNRLDPRALNGHITSVGAEYYEFPMFYFFLCHVV